MRTRNTDIVIDVYTHYRIFTILVLSEKKLKENEDFVGCHISRKKCHMNASKFAICRKV